MLTAKDCIALSDHTREEIDAIAEDEPLPEERQEGPACNIER